MDWSQWRYNPPTIIFCKILRLLKEIFLGGSRHNDIMKPSLCVQSMSAIYTFIEALVSGICDGLIQILELSGMFSSIVGYSALPYWSYLAGYPTIYSFISNKIDIIQP